MFPIYFILHSLLFNLYHKNTKNIYLISLSLSDLTFASGREGIDKQPLNRVGCEVLVCLCRYEGLACSLLLD